MRSFFYWVLVFGIIALLGQIIAGAGHPPQWMQSIAPAHMAGPMEAPTPVATSAPRAASTTPLSAWSYSQEHDAMRDTTSYFARLQSSDEQTFNPPYDGGYATLMLRQRQQDGLSILLMIDGQLLCNLDDNDQISVKFDSSAIETLPCLQTYNENPGTLFIVDGGFVERLKHSSHLTIEANFYHSGSHQMNFNTDGLVWPPNSLVKPSTKGVH